jgi:predicted dehydrogenase
MAKPRDSRRLFIGTVAGGLAGAVTSPASVLQASERVRFALIGAGDRGLQLAREALACPNTELAAVADVYSRRLDEARRLAPAALATADYRQALDHPAVDAVLIASPQHLHAEHFIAALDAGKHVYVEKTMAFTVDQAKRMRAAHRNHPKLSVQVGHQACSSGAVTDAAAFATPSRLGRVSLIQAFHFRNTPAGKPSWTRPVYPDVTPENVHWELFLGEAPRREFDPHRFVNWRLFHEYSGGNVFENLSHQLAFWYKVLNLQIPSTVTMLGDVLLSADGRDVPDVMQVTLRQPEDLLISWSSGFGNNHPGVGEQVLGTHGTISRATTLRYAPQKVNLPHQPELVGQTPTPKNAHMQNFLDAIRAGAALHCPFDLGFRVSIACRMAVDSYLEGRTVRWDPSTESIL